MCTSSIAGHPPFEAHYWDHVEEIHPWHFMGLLWVLQVCFQLLKISAVQIHAKLSVPERLNKQEKSFCSPGSPCIVLYCSENYNILMFKFTLLLCLSMQQTICQHSCYRGLGLGDGKHGDVLSLCGLEEWICLASSLACCLSYCFWVGEFAMLMVAKIDQKMHSIHL